MVNPGPPPAPTLRGDTAQTTLMEMLQDGYIHAVAAASGCGLAKPSPDVNGVDWIVTHSSVEHTKDRVAEVWLQLKSTYQTAPNDLVGQSSFGFTLKNQHLAHLSLSPVVRPRLLIVMVVPRDMADWVEASGDYFALRHACYWVNLEGQPESGAHSTTVTVPTENVFDDHGLCAIMAKVGKGEKPE